MQTRRQLDEVTRTMNQSLSKQGSFRATVFQTCLGRSWRTKRTTNCTRCSRKMRVAGLIQRQQSVKPKKNKQKKTHTSAQHMMVPCSMGKCLHTTSQTSVIEIHVATETRFADAPRTRLDGQRSVVVSNPSDLSQVVLKPSSP